jgi:hypothetical protein
MAYVRTDKGFVNLATARRVYPTRNDAPNLWTILDAAGEVAHFECPANEIELRLNPEPDYSEDLANIAYHLDRLAELFEDIVGTAHGGSRYLRNLDLSRD